MLDLFDLIKDLSSTLVEYILKKDFNMTVDAVARLKLQELLLKPSALCLFLSYCCDDELEAFDAFCHKDNHCISIEEIEAAAYGLLNSPYCYSDDKGCIFIPCDVANAYSNIDMSIVNDRRNERIWIRKCLYFLNNVGFVISLDDFYEKIVCCAPQYSFKKDEVALMVSEMPSYMKTYSIVESNIVHDMLEEQMEFPYVKKITKTITADDIEKCWLYGPESDDDIVDEDEVWEKVETMDTNRCIECEYDDGEYELSVEEYDLLDRVMLFLSQNEIKFSFKPSAPHIITLIFREKDKVNKVQIKILSSTSIVIGYEYPLEIPPASLRLCAIFACDYNALKAYPTMCLDCERRIISVESVYLSSEVSNFDSKLFWRYLEAVIQASFEVNRDVSSLLHGDLSDDKKEYYERITGDKLKELYDIDNDTMRSNLDLESASINPSSDNRLIGINDFDAISADMDSKLEGSPEAEGEKQSNQVDMAQKADKSELVYKNVTMKSFFEDNSAENLQNPTCIYEHAVAPKVDRDVHEDVKKSIVKLNDVKIVYDAPEQWIRDVLVINSLLESKYIVTEIYGKYYGVDGGNLAVINDSANSIVWLVPSETVYSASIKTNKVYAGERVYIIAVKPAFSNDEDAIWYPIIVTRAYEGELFRNIFGDVLSKALAMINFYQLKSVEQVEIINHLRQNTDLE